MRTSISPKLGVVFLYLFVACGSVLHGQALGPGKYIGQVNHLFPIAVLDLEYDGTFSLEYSNIEHGGVRGAGEWVLNADSLQLTFDQKSLTPLDLSQLAASSFDVLEKSPSDSTSISLLVLESEQLFPIPAAKISKTEGQSDLYVRTDIDGKATLSLSTDATVSHISVSFVGYLGIDILTDDLNGYTSEIVVKLAPSIMDSPVEPISQTKVLMLGISYSKDGDLFLNSSDSSTTLRFRN